MSAGPAPLGPEELGERLRQAREAARITQAAAASALEMARTTVVAIEQGLRRPRIDELQRFSTLYGTALNTLLRREAVQVDLRPRFRRVGDVSSDVEVAAGLLTRLVQAEVELENLLGVTRLRTDPPERPLSPGDVMRQADQDAMELRQWLGLGLAPIHDVVAVLELQLGARVFLRRLPPKVSGLYAFEEAAGACILLNLAHPRERRAQTAAHELGHFVSTRRSPDALYDGSPEASREERYANAFARAFLTPAQAVTAKFLDITAGAKALTRRHVIILAHTFGVSQEAMVRRLEELKLTKLGTWDWFSANGGITRDQVRTVLGDASLLDRDQDDPRRLVSIRVHALASEAWRRELLSEGQIARLLHIDRFEARELIDDYEKDLAFGADIGVRLV